MTRFTAEEAFDARDCGEPIMITRAAVDRMLSQHSTTFANVDDPCNVQPDETGMFDAAAILAWLGY